MASYAQARKRGFFEIAVLTPLTGKWAKGGWITKRGYDIWAERANAEGGIEAGGERYPVRLIYFDTRSDPGYARLLAEGLLSHEGVDFIFGPYSSDETLAVAPAIERAKVPHITGSAESEEISKRGFAWTLGVLLTDSSPLKAPLRLLKRRLDPGLTTAAILSADDLFSCSTAKAFHAAVEELRFRLKYYATYPSNLEEFVPFIERVEGHDPDLLIASGHIDNLINIIRAAKLLDYAPRVYVMHYGVTTQDFIDALGNDAKHILGVSQWSPEADHRGPVFGTAQDFHRLFVER
ncbi:MAG: amino acid ABC transporter substrate-binding protein, partial [Candidatus Bipolaricaulia bacterium]